MKVVPGGRHIVTRFPPSPTGNLHIGGARTALFNYLFTKHHGGKIYLRLENTDEERSEPKYEQNILESLKWLALFFDLLPDGKPFWRQSERKEIYRGYLKKLVDSGHAYLSKETEGKRMEVVRFRNPNKKIVFCDLIRGSIKFETMELGDMIIAKSLEEPLYHLAVVVDDYEMGITHVIRGEDHISNTPRQILLQEALGFPRPEYAHIPLILAPDRSKLSKRHGAVAVAEYQSRGYLSQALVNYLALLGWNPGTDRELFSLGELISAFDLTRVQRGGAIFNEEKLAWFNKEYLKRQGGAETLIPHIPVELSKGREEAQMAALSQMLFERINVYGDIVADMKEGEFDYLLKTPAYEQKLLEWKKASSLPKPHLEKVIALLQQVKEKSFVADEIRTALLSYAEKVGKGEVLWPLRVALTGRERSPDPFTVAAVLGKEEAIKRLKSAVAVLS